MLRKGFHPNIKYVLDCCLMYGVNSLALKCLSLTFTSFFAKRYWPGDKVLTVLQPMVRRQDRRIMGKILFIKLSGGGILRL